MYCIESCPIKVLKQEAVYGADVPPFSGTLVQASAQEGRRSQSRRRLPLRFIRLTAPLPIEQIIQYLLAVAKVRALEPIQCVSEVNQMG